MKWLEYMDRAKEKKKGDTVTVRSEQTCKNYVRAELPANPSEYDSFERALFELRLRFEGRGMRQSVRRDAKRQSLAVMNTRALAPGAYADYGTPTALNDRFRTGECDGMRYMTSDDFVRYYREHRRSCRADADISTMAVRYEGRGSVPAPKKKKPLLAPATAESKRFVGKIASRLPAAVRERHPEIERRAAEAHTWIKADRIEEDPKSKRAFPVSVASAILVMVISLTLVIGGTVMYSDANASYREASDQLQALKTEANNLEQELAASLDLVSLECYARESLGMVDRVYAGGTYLDSTVEEKIEVYGEEKSSFGLSTLLSALGFGE